MRVKDIIAQYRRVGLPLAAWDGIRGGWAALSQYGYALSYHETRQAARRATVSFYRYRRDLIA